VGATAKVSLKGLDAATGSGSYNGSVFGELLFGGGLAVIHSAAASRSTPQAILWTREDAFT
jgi:hypothetical protein